MDFDKKNRKKYPDTEIHPHLQSFIFTEMDKIYEIELLNIVLMRDE